MTLVVGKVKARQQSLDYRRLFEIVYCMALIMHNDGVLGGAS